MNCMKCGREVAAGQVFCEACLTEMEKYPVRPGTVIQLPRRREESAVKKPYARRKTPPTLEEQVKHLRKVCRVLFGLLLIALVLIVVLAFPGVKELAGGKSQFLPGQNYSSVVDTIPLETE